MKIFYTSLCILALASVGVAQNVGQCGWGSKLFSGQKGIIPQVLAVTTNGTSGNQTFAISSGTSGCTQHGVVRSSWKTAMFINSNMDKLAMDMSAGEGESLDSLARLLEVKEADKKEFFSVAKSSFSKIFTSTEVKSEDVYKNLVAVLKTNDKLSIYAPTA